MRRIVTRLRALALLLAALVGFGMTVPAASADVTPSDHSTGHVCCNPYTDDNCDANGNCITPTPGGGSGGGTTTPPTTGGSSGSGGSSGDLDMGNEYQCNEVNQGSTPCGGSGWSCTFDHDGYFPISGGGKYIYHYYICTWAGGSGGGGGTTTPPTPSYETYYAYLYFNMNGGTGGPSTVSDSAYDDTSYGSITLTVPSATPTKAGYTFDHWQGSDGRTHQPGDRISVGYDSSVTLTAQWRQATHRITFKANNGTDEADRYYTRAKGETVPIEDGSAFTAPDGKVFAGWSTNQGGPVDDKYKPGSTFTMGDADVTLYAQWKDKAAPLACVPVTGAPLSDLLWPAAGGAFALAGIGYMIVGLRRTRRMA